MMTPSLSQVMSPTQLQDQKLSDVTSIYLEQQREHARTESVFGEEGGGREGAIGEQRGRGGEEGPPP